jgi:hypothetical protein
LVPAPLVMSSHSQAFATHREAFGQQLPTRLHVLLILHVPIEWQSASTLQSTHFPETQR